MGAYVATVETIISGTGLYTPKESVSNDELVTAFNGYVDEFNERHKADIDKGIIAPLERSSSEFIEKASGIKSRFVIDKSGIIDADSMCPKIPERPNDQPSIQCEMAVAAAEQAMARANKTAQDIDVVIVACSNLQRAYPALAVEVQDALGIQGFSFDMNVACSSATFGIQAAEGLLKSGAGKCVLMVNPEICTGHLNFRDRDSHFIFGDACTAVIIENAAENELKPGSFKLIGSRCITQYSNNIRNNYGFLNRCDPSGVGRKDKLFVQQGRKVFKEVVPLVAKLITQHLTDLELDPHSLNRLWLHQANQSMNELVCKKVLGHMPNEKEAPIILDTYANTSSAGSIIAFHKYHEDLKSGDVGVICSFGAGYSAGNIVVEKV